ncbi:erythromycin esterase family protein [Butyrivibrio sp. NC2002]|uniref:erythromycin esterase family protein n=1 Tax=Butyrivibrio sp. NC2002 TaxID=1410610 RepID=UPI0005610B3B|nr:erythromycin esterase family protein [Butyrivibrio sp. NC2002]
MKVLKKIGKVLLIIIIAISILLGVGLNYKTVLAMHKNKTMVENAKAVSGLDIPDNVEIVGLGEATHGSVEFQESKLEVLKMLVENEGYSAFCLEADFGDCLRANEFVQGGEGDAREIANNLSFNIYHTQQMADLLDWMREYNASVSEDKKIRFYGFDMQNPEKCVEYLYDYMKKNNITVKETSEIDYYIDENRTESMTEDHVKKVKEELEDIKKEINVSDGNDQNLDALFATKAADNIATSADYVLIDFQADYQKKFAARDTAMADNVSWILDLEKKIGSGKIMLAAHDGHISKKPHSMLQPVTMGGLLKEKYGDAYYSLGTDFFKGKTNASVSSVISSEYQRKDFYFTTADPIAYQAKYMDDKRFYLDFETVSSEDNKAIYDLIHSEVSMGTLGEGLSGIYYFMHSAYRIEMKPADLYDGMIYYYNVSAISPQY